MVTFIIRCDPIRSISGERGGRSGRDREIAVDWLICQFAHRFDTTAGRSDRLWPACSFVSFAVATIRPLATHVASISSAAAVDCMSSFHGIGCAVWQFGRSNSDRTSMLREARWSRHGSVWGCDIAVTGPSGFLTGGVLSGAESVWGGGLMSRRFMSYNRRDAYDWQCVRVRLKHGNGTLHRRALLRVELWYVMKSVWKTGRPANECITLLQMSCVVC